MNIKCVWEHNGDDTLLYSSNCIGAFTRGSNKETAVAKMEEEIKSYLKWINSEIPESFDIAIVQQKDSTLKICDADSDVLFEEEKRILTYDEYLDLKKLAIKSARDFYTLYNSAPEQDKSSMPKRISFYGQVPRTANEMYAHTKNVNSYYFGEIGIHVENKGTIYECREKGFELVEKNKDFLDNKIYYGSYGEAWSLRKVIRRFIWHDRIHAKAMYRMINQTFGEGIASEVFKFKL